VPRGRRRRSRPLDRPELGRLHGGRGRLAPRRRRRAGDDGPRGGIRALPAAPTGPLPRGLAARVRPDARVTETLRAFGLGDEDLAAWRESSLPEEGFADWLTDRVARRPRGRPAWG